VFVSGVLRKISGPTCGEVTGDGRQKLLKEELRDLYCPPNIVWQPNGGGWDKKGGASGTY